MNASEAADLLDMLSMVDNRTVSIEMADAWAWALDDVPVQRAVLAARQLIRAGEPWVDVKTIRRQLAAMRPTFERDVRSAKARGLVAGTWDPRTPLPVAIEAQLREAQAAEWAESNDRPDELAAGDTATPEQIRKALAGIAKSVPE